MYRNKRGLSDIVTTVFIIVLVIVAIVLIWSFVRPAIERGGTRVQSGSECLTIDLEAVTCNAAAKTISIKRNPGAGELGSLRVVIGDQVVDTTATGVTPTATPYPAELQTIVYSFTGVTPVISFDGDAGALGVQGGLQVNVGGVLAGGQVCSPTRDPVVCTA